jgi:dihydroorotate dehydrogenase (fumarate)
MADRFLLHAELHDGESAGFLPDHGHYEGALDRYLEHLRRLKARLDPGHRQPQRRHAVGLGRPRQGAAGGRRRCPRAQRLPRGRRPSESGDAVEARYVALLAELKRTVSVPVVMKLPPFFSSLPHFVKRLEAVGADGVSLFNRFFQPDIDLDALEMVEQLQLSSPRRPCCASAGSPSCAPTPA